MNSTDRPFELETLQRYVRAHQRVRPADHHLDGRASLAALRLLGTLVVVPMLLTCHDDIEEQVERLENPAKETAPMRRDSLTSGGWQAFATQYCQHESNGTPGTRSTALC